MKGWVGVVLAAGKGTRMKSRLPKVLHRICGVEMVRLAVDAVRAAGVERVVLVAPSHRGPLRQVFGDSVDYAVQGTQDPQGTGGAVLAAGKAIDGEAAHLLVVNGDIPLIRISTLCRAMDRHAASGAVLTLVTASEAPVDSLGRVLRGPQGQVVAVVEDAEAGDEGQAIRDVNVGVYCFDASWLWPRIKRLPTAQSGEVYLTSLVSLASQEGESVADVTASAPEEALGVNTRVHLAQAEALLRSGVCQRWMLEGVTILDPATTYLDATVELGQDTVIYPNTAIYGKSRVGADCELGPGTVIRDTTIGDRCKVGTSVLEGAVLEDQVEVGPFCHLRPGAYLERGVHLGNFGEVKEARLGRGVKMGHFSYIGDADIGRDVNIGAGTVTCNFDGVRKSRTVVGEGAFLGSDTMLVAPVRVGDRASTGAGSVVTRDVPPDTLVAGVPARATRHRANRVAKSPSPGAGVPKDST